MKRSDAWILHASMRNPLFVKALEINLLFSIFRHYSDGNLPQAIKFVNKSLNLYPTDTARNLLTTYENSSKQYHHGKIFYSRVIHK